MNTCAPHFSVIIIYILNTQFKMQYYSPLLCWLGFTARPPSSGSGHGRPPARRTTSGSGSSSSKTPAHLLPVTYLPSSVVISKSSAGLMNYCMNSVVVLNCTDCISCASVCELFIALVVLRTFGHFSLHYLSFILFHCIRCILMFHCISCTDI